MGTYGSTMAVWVRMALGARMTGESPELSGNEFRRLLSGVFAFPEKGVSRVGPENRAEVVGTESTNWVPPMRSHYLRSSLSGRAG